MDYNKELENLREKENNLFLQAKESGFVYDKNSDKFIEQQNDIYIIHIAINTLGGGESLGQFELYDKLFKIDADFALKLSKIDNLDDFMDVLFSKEWDEDFQKCNVFEDIQFSDWFYHTTEESHYSNYDNIITFRFLYIDCTMGNVSIIKCKPSLLDTHKNIYHSTTNYVLE